MLEIITQINNAINGFVWGVPAMACIIGAGIVLSLRTGFIQFRKLGYALKVTLGKVFSKEEAAAGSVTPFQAVCTALAATIGTGSVAGVAGAIAIGGPGVVFWMWCSALLGMCTKFSEVTLAVHYRERNTQGDWVGGPMYYIKNGLSKNWHFLGTLYAAFAVVTVFGTGNATQVNTIVASVNTALLSFNVIDQSMTGTVALVIGIVIAVIVVLVLFGGVKRIGAVVEKLVPFMAMLYVVLGLGVLLLNLKKLPSAFYSIIHGAFNPSAVTGGVVGNVFMCMQKGVGRGIFSNEAGLGTGSIAHASTSLNDPVEQGMYGIFEVFGTIIICTLTSMIILCSGITVNYGVPAGAELTISGLVATYGNWVTIFSALALCCFAFSTILGWGLYGSRALEYLSSNKLIKPFMVAYALVATVGATMDLGLMWSIADTCNGIMAIPNLIALFLLSGKVKELVQKWQNK